MKKILNYFMVMIGILFPVNSEYINKYVGEEVITFEYFPKEKEEVEIVEEENSQETAYDVLVGRLTAYGPDCLGCSGYLAYKGINVLNGNIYYNDYQYGNIRIVAGDKRIPFGTIVKINDEMLAIVLDRGGAIGFNKYALFDLLVNSEKESYVFGMYDNVKFTILRYGF